ncbi:MAG: fumarylacetoacetate hydrolase family protein, partial [Planctomycetota bacterium]
MKLGSASVNGRAVLVGLRGDEIVDLTSALLENRTSVQCLLEASILPEGRLRIADSMKTAPAVSPDSITWRPPVPRPAKILCVGLNYRDHAKETGAEIPSEPLIFNKLNTALAAHEQSIELPSVSDKVDYEAELVVVIGKAGRDISRDDALDHVAGYTVGHDVSARDWQKGKPGKQWLLGKSFDTFAPSGPWFVTADEIEDPHDLSISMRINGEGMQQSSTKHLIFPVDFLVSYISQICTLQPGDLIFTGTPHGVGAARDPQVFLKSGDVAEVEIGGICTLRNPVIDR